MAPRKQKPAERVVFSAEEVEKLHLALLDVFEKHIRPVGRVPVIEQVGFAPGAWRRAKADRVEFELQQLDELAERPRTRKKVQVGQVSGLETVWVSWYERWRVGVTAFVPDAMSLAFWVGEKSAAKELMFRAEWDHTDTVTASGAAQPHWNIDHPVGASVVLAEREYTQLESAQLVPLAAEPVLEPEQQVRLGLVELQGEPTASLSVAAESSAATRGSKRFTVSRYHLGMAGSWTPGGRGKGWQLPLIAEAERLPDWLDLCLGYVATEFVRYGVTEAVDGSARAEG